MTRADVEAMLAAIDLPSLGASIEERRAALVRMPSHDVRMQACEGALNVVFARVVVELHSPGGMYATTTATATASRFEGLASRLQGHSHQHTGVLQMQGE